MFVGFIFFLFSSFILMGSDVEEVLKKGSNVGGRRDSNWFSSSSICTQLYTSWVSFSRGGTFASMSSFK